MESQISLEAKRRHRLDFQQRDLNNNRHTKRKVDPPGETSLGYSSEEILSKEIDLSNR